MTKVTKILAIGIAVAAITLGALFPRSPIPTKLGFYRWLASRDERCFGFTPAFHYGIKWGYTFDQLYKEDLTGQNALIIGANAGIGFESALTLSRLGASVTLACRNPSRCEEAAKKIRSDKVFKGKDATTTVDTSSLRSVKEFSQTFLKTNDVLDMLFL